MSRTLIPLAAIAGLVACAPVAEPGQDTIVGLDTSRQCFFTRSVNGFSEAPDSPQGEDRLFVTTGPREKFLLEPLGACTDIDFAQQIAIDNRFGPSLCTGGTTDILIPSPSIGTQRCRVRVVGKVTE